MIVDSSALLAVILGEPDAERFDTTMIDATSLRMSAANWLEAAIVVDNRKSSTATVRFEELVRELQIEIVPVSVDLAYRARCAHREFGRGNHSAGLNYGDCFAYALAILDNDALLFKGNDFRQTDVVPALKG